MRNISEKSINYSISLSDDPTYKHAYVIGDFDDCNWQEYDKYRMVPDISKTYFQWMYEGLELVEGNQLKCRIESETEDTGYFWSYNDSANGGVDGDGNRKVSSNESGIKTVYWKGTADKGDIKIYLAD